MAALEVEIVEWAADRPAWQVEALARLARGEYLSEQDYIEIADRLIADAAAEVEPLAISDMPRSSNGARKVRLVEMACREHVNALVEGSVLTFGADGLTVVYGDNGSGKSGFARLLKRVVRSRATEEVLTNIFSDRADSQPSAEVVVSVDDETLPMIEWAGASTPELRQIGFFDESCGDEYLAAESEVTFRPAGIHILDGLIKTCDSVRQEIDRRAMEHSRRAVDLPRVGPDRAAGRFLAQLSASTEDQEIAESCHVPDGAEARLEELREEEARLVAADPDRERRRLTERADRFGLIADHLTLLRDQLSQEVLGVLEEKSTTAESARRLASEVAGASFDDEPLGGIGTSAWRTLWEAARAYSQAEAYRAESFPKTDHARCVLCQQELDSSARARLIRFEESVRDQTEQEAQAAERLARLAAQEVQQIVVTPMPVAVALEAIEDDELAERCRAELGSYEVLKEAFASRPPTEKFVWPDTAIHDQLRSLQSAERERASAVDAATVRQLLQELKSERLDLEDRLQMLSKRASMTAERDALRAQRRMGSAKRLTETAGITRKATELTRSHVTSLVRDRFTRETDRLRLENVTLEDTGGQKGRLQHRPAFVGAIQQPRMSRVLSEGEQTALGLAGFFTEAFLDESKSAIVLDDPVSSLDHIRRAYVANRLAELSTQRQVVVFTHDLAFVGELNRAAEEFGAHFTERSVERRGDGRPGVCLDAHPWKSRDVKARLGNLETDLAALGRNREGWDQSTYEKEAADWAGRLSETWERLISLELVGKVVDRASMEVRPKMVRMLAAVTEDDDKEFQESYARISRWARRHDKSVEGNYLAPEPDEMAAELEVVRGWFARLRKYANS